MLMKNDKNNAKHVIVYLVVGFTELFKNFIK